MDSTYLKANVMDALIEGLTSMAVSLPDDEIEYIGKYLLTYVDRKKSHLINKDEIDTIESKLKVYLSELEVKKLLEDAKKDEIIDKQTNFNNFLTAINKDYNTKIDAMNAINNYIVNQLNIPSSYIAIKKVVNDNEELHYISTSDNNKHILGKKLIKNNNADEEETPVRQGVSFEAFKLPEVPEEEQEDADEENPTPKPVPTLQPLIIDNVMRDKRCKFFGIPKLGSYVAIPFSYQSVEHDAGVSLVGEEGGETPPELAITKKEQQFIIAVDTVGQFRSIRSNEIDQLKQIGDELVKLFERVELAMGEEQLLFMKGDQYKVFCETCAGDFATAAGETEAAATAKCAEAIAADPAMAEEGVSELLKPFKEAAAVVEAWNGILSAANISSAVITLKDYVLPPPAPVINLIYAICCLVGFAPVNTQNVCGDADWTAIRKNCISSLISKISQYDPSAKLEDIPKCNTLNVVKAFSEANGLLEAGNFPANMPICSAAFVPWLTKAMAAREAAIAYYGESQTSLE